MIHSYEKLQIKLKRLLEKRKTAVDRVMKNEKNQLEARKLLAKEQADVEQMEKQSLSSFVQNLFGKYDEKLNKEKQDLITAKIEFDMVATLYLAALRELESIDEALEELRTEIASLREELKQTNHDFHKKITQKEEEQVLLRQEADELNEAVRIGETVLNAIHRVLEELDSANSMATVDLFADNLFFDLAKYESIDVAERELTYLEQALDRYKKELKDVDFETGLAYEELDQMSRAFDIFFDNIFSDWTAKDTIQRNISMLEEILGEVKEIQELLSEREEKLKERILISEEYL